MNLALEPSMGRPKKERDAADEKQTTHVRLFVDLAEMISWIVRVEKRTPKSGAAQLLDPMIRPQITARYRRYLPHIEKMKAIEKEMKRAEEEAVNAIKKSSKSVEE